jgi:hypothetical protein
MTAPLGRRTSPAGCGNHGVCPLTAVDRQRPSQRCAPRHPADLGLRLGDLRDDAAPKLRPTAPRRTQVPGRPTRGRCLARCRARICLFRPGLGRPGPPTQRRRSGRCNSGCRRCTRCPLGRRCRSTSPFRRRCTSGYNSLCRGRSVQSEPCACKHRLSLLWGSRCQSGTCRRGSPRRLRTRRTQKR